MLGSSFFISTKVKSIPFSQLAFNVQVMRYFDSAENNHQ